MKNPFEMNHSANVDTSTVVQITQRLFVEGNHDIVCRSANFVISKVKNIDFEIIRYAKSILEGAKAISIYDEHSCYVVGTHKSNNTLLIINVTNNEDVSSVGIKIFSDIETVLAIKELLEDKFKTETLPSIKWWFMGERGEATRDYYLPKYDTVIYPEFYPDLGDPTKYIAEYMASDEAILLIAGPPGTGKTTLLRHLIHDYRLSAHVIYDETIMKKDSPFQAFLFGEGRGYRPASVRNWDDDDDVASGGDIMIIEDADSILTSRERDNNKLMSRFLNISDGLIKLPNKKLVFTTNINDFGTIDPALLRPGRCFGVMHTRALNLNEAQAAARVAGLPIPTEKREYTLAELFNGGKKATIRTIGFGSRHQ